MKYFVKLTFVLISVVSALSFAKPSEEQAAWEYIELYKELAVVEMHRSGIPASIILAQALHESNYGLSKLALQANNHFGIKCKTYWVGKTYYYKDDDTNREGDLIESCFRSYDTALESYVDHSNFLMFTKHYNTLFNYDKTDYKGWAAGLKECGYATDGKYTEKLISKIEKYYLNQYDYWDSPYRSVLSK